MSCVLVGKRLASDYIPSSPACPQRCACRSDDLVLAELSSCQSSKDRHHLQGNSITAGDPFSATPGPSFAGFSFPLLKPVLGMGGNPVVRQ
jgi:hypothetical protein